MGRERGREGGQPRLCQGQAAPDGTRGSGPPGSSGRQHQLPRSPGGWNKQAHLPAASWPPAPLLECCLLGPGTERKPSGGKRRSSQGDFMDGGSGMLCLGHVGGSRTASAARIQHQCVSSKWGICVGFRIRGLRKTTSSVYYPNPRGNECLAG